MQLFPPRPKPERNNKSVVEMSEVIERIPKGDGPTVKTRTISEPIYSRPITHARFLEGDQRFRVDPATRKSTAVPALHEVKMRRRSQRMKAFVGHSRPNP